MKTYETPTEMAVRLNRLQEQVEQLLARIEWLEHHRHATECGRMDTGEPFK